MPTSILMLLFDSGYADNVCTNMSSSLVTFEKRLITVKRRKYLSINRSNDLTKSIRIDDDVAIDTIEIEMST